MAYVVLELQWRDERATAFLAQDEPLRKKVRHCLTHRRAAHAQALHAFGFRRQHLAHRTLTVLADEPRYAVGELHVKRHEAGGVELAQALDGEGVF
jgi:hypothetical protein